MNAFFDHLEPRSLLSASMLGTNLIVNGDFEAGPGATSVGTVTTVVPGWEMKGMSVVRYGSPAFPTAAHGPMNGGANFVSGIKASPLISQPMFQLSQKVPVYQMMGDIDAGRVSWDFAAALGGFGKERDEITAHVRFHGDFNSLLQDTSVRGPSAADRGNQTGFRVRTGTSVVPVGTRVIEVLLDASRADGIVADGYADNVSLKLRPRGGTAKGFIAGTVFNDLSGDGGLSEGDRGLPGVTVYADLNKNKKLDRNEPRATSDAAGRYEIAGVRRGAVKVQIVSPATFRDTTGTRQTTVAGGVAAGSSRVDFGASQTTLIAGNVFADNNGNGKRDAAEGGFAGVQVYLDANDNGELDPTERAVMTDVGGKFTFIATRGKYTVRMQAAPETRQSTPARDRGIIVTLGKGGVSSKNVFGVKRI